MNYRATGSEPVEYRWLLRQVHIGIALLTAGCLGEPLMTAPAATDNALLRRAMIGADGTVQCAVAVRLPDGKYRTKRQVLTASPTVIGSSDIPLDFVLVTWEREGPNPVRLVTCRIPKTPEGITYIKNALGKDGIAITPKARRDVSVRGPFASAAVTYMDVDETSCDPADVVDYGCSCSNTECEGWTTTSLSEGDAPLESSETPELFSQTYASSADPEYDPTLYYPVIICNLKTDYIHLSTSIDAEGLVSVHGWTDCSKILSQVVEVTLEFQECVDLGGFLFCWYPERGKKRKEGVMAYLDVNAKAECEPGYWFAYTWHQITFGPPYNPRVGSYNTGRYRYFSACTLL